MDELKIVFTGHEDNFSTMTNFITAKVVSNTIFYIPGDLLIML